ncbi:TetR/AcrR family transcriptional regulator [Campylobacter sp. MIT 99-7217]|uniref:TetR/AcrR family transcriptional regulator n=1 Tax=Campylobacter sp. MIT 99-7217 TaxID=535091 RepID=UPI0011594EFA|nr:TetR/AcrR family transcriptional regulator [Campylobacter sp. MIT 99-7217]TQR33845.1 TetR/AcrR family transcriptional regulator [Campylobacter sp. MIT 99-7217]
MQKLTDKNLKRDEKIKAVALELFLQRGYEATHLKDIIKISGGSFSNIYKSFESKEALFVELIQDHCTSHFKDIENLIQDAKNKSLEEFLSSFGRAYMEIFFHPDSIGLVKVVFSQISNEKLGLVKWFESNQNKLSDSLVKDFLSKQKEENISQNASRLANLFCIMLREPYFKRCVCLGEFPNKKEQIEHVDFIVQIFLKGLLSFH